MGNIDELSEVSIPPTQPPINAPVVEQSDCTDYTQNLDSNPEYNQKADSPLEITDVPYMEDFLMREDDFTDHVSPIADETPTPNHPEPTSPFEQSDEAVGQANVDGGSNESDLSSDVSDSTTPPKKRGRPKGWRKTSPTVSSDEVKSPPVPEPSDSILSLGLPNLATGQTGIGGNNADMFAPEALRVSQDFVNEAGVEHIYGAIPVRRPSGKEFIRVRPGDEWQLSVAIIEDTDREIWIVKPDIIAGVFDEVSYVLLRLAVNRSGVPFLWALKLPKDGRRNLWNDTAMAAADCATCRWVRVKSDMEAGQYTILAAKTDFGEPKWIDLSLQDVLQLAFKDRIIADNDHPVLKQLRGEI